MAARRGRWVPASVTGAARGSDSIRRRGSTIRVIAVAGAGTPTPQPGPDLIVLSKPFQMSELSAAVSAATA